MATQTKKFRPYFSPEELKEIISALKENPTQSRLALIKYLQNYAIKIDHGVFEPAITLKPSIEQQLEMTEVPDDSNPARFSSLRLQSYLKWKKSPSSCSPVEITRANEYRYENDLMEGEELQKYETALLEFNKLV